MNNKKLYNYFRKKLNKLEKKYFRTKTICYHFTNEDAYNKIKGNGIFKINRKENVKDEKDVEYSYKVLRECIDLCEKVEDKDGEFGNWLYEHSSYDLYCFSTTYDKNNRYLMSEYGSYCIKVNTQKMFAELRKNHNLNNIKMGYAEYNPVKQKEKLTELLNLYYDICEFENDSGLAEECKDYILFFLDLIKLPCYFPEKEIRIVFNFNDVSLQEKYEEKHINKYADFLGECEMNIAAKKKDLCHFDPQFCRFFPLP
ncbi:MAG: hypothetical protein IKQ61_13120 [Spirochaetales bacterium]|nr:hypothetical protein [Spirochaetales bacterium]